MIRLVAIACVLSGCGTPPPSWQPDAGPCVAYEVPAATNLSQPVVSFRTDVMPVFAQSCSSASCHGATSGTPLGQIFLGAQRAGDAQIVYAALVGQASSEARMPYVTAADPPHSYLMHKLDGDQCTLASACAGGDCGASMPYASALAIETRDVIRRWVAQGAADN